MHTDFPTGLPDYGYSMQAMALAHALTAQDNAPVYRVKIREWLERIEDPSRSPFAELGQGRLLAEFLTDLVRIGAGLPATG